MGRTYEEMAVGQEFVHTPSRTVTETDNVMFCSISVSSRAGEHFIDAQYPYMYMLASCIEPHIFPWGT